MESGQNFLNLLFGGVQRGIGRMDQQQQRKTDLFLTLQKIMQAQELGRAKVGAAYDIAGERTAATMAGVMQRETAASNLARYRDVLTSLAERRLGLEKEKAVTAAGLAQATKGYKEMLTEQGAKYPYASIFSNMRQAITSQLQSLEGQTTNYETITKNQWEKLDEVTRNQFTLIPAKGEYDQDIYKRLKPQAQVGRATLLEQLANISQFETLANMAKVPIPEDTTSVDDILDDLLKGAAEEIE